MYAVQSSRPCLCQCVSLLIRYQDKGNDNLYKAFKRVLWYIRGFINVKLIFKPHFNTNVFRGFIEPDWGGDLIDRKSTTGYLFKLFNCTLSWYSNQKKKKKCVSISSTKSEYVALFFAVSEACWLRKLLRDFHIFDLRMPTTIYEDNQSAIKIANNPENNKRLKHVDIRFHFIKENILVE